MANRRMFSLKVVDTDQFLDMPPSTQNLYFHLGLRGDDDGFVAKPKAIMEAVKATDDDMKILLAKGFIIPFESGICVIRHWRIHNYIQKDRYEPTQYLEERQKLALNNGKYEKNENVSILDTQVRLGKVRLDNIPSVLEKPPVSSNFLDEPRLVTPQDEEYEEEIEARGYDKREASYLLQWAKEIKGARFSEIPTQRKKINGMLKAKYTIQEITDCWEWCEAQDWITGIDFKIVASQISKVKKEQGPRHVKIS